jgi:hypothetical protein
MNNYSLYELERTKCRFKEHKDYEKMKDIKKQIIEHFIHIKDEYVNEKELMDKLINIFDTIGKGNINRCIDCNIDIGESNPRQLCGKWICNNS